MFAERVMIETDDQGNPCHLPKLPPNSKVEVIFLFSDDAHQAFQKRQISPKIAGKGSIVGDIVSPVIPETEWEVLR